MEPREKTISEETVAKQPEPPAAYIPACGTLCDAFWWARPSDPGKLPKTPD